MSFFYSWKFNIHPTSSCCHTQPSQSYTAEVADSAGAVPPYSRGPHKNQMSNPPTGKNTISKLQRMICKVPRRLRQTLLRATTSAITSRISTSKDQRELAAMVECSSGGGGKEALYLRVVLCVYVCAYMCKCGVSNCFMTNTWGSACVSPGKKGERKKRAALSLECMYKSLCVWVGCLYLSVTLQASKKV